MFRMAIAAIGAVGLVACTDQPANGADTEEQTTEATPPAEEALTLTAEGYGPLRVGMTLDEVTAAMGPDADPEAVGGPEPEYCDQFRPENAPEGVLVMIEQGVLTRISLIEPGVTTDRGISVGDSAAAVREAYGDALEVSPHTYVDPPGEYLTWWASGAPEGEYTNDEAARGIRYEIGEDGNVQVIHGGGPAIQYVEGCL